MSKKTQKEISLKEQMKQDGYVDSAKKLGQKTKGNSGFVLDLGDDVRFASIYVGNGMAKRYIDLIVDDMTRQWIEIPEDTDGQILKKMRKLKAKSQFKNALRASKLFGGSIIFMVIEDGKEPNEPVDLNNIKTISKLKYFSRRFVKIDQANYYKDATKGNFGDPEFFNVTVNGQIKTIHESRCLVFKGEYYPQEELGITPTYEKYWGLSILTALHEMFEDYGLALQALSRSLLKANVDVLKIKNLMKLLANPDGKKQLDARAQIFDLAKSVTTTLLLDNDESYESVTQAFNGVAEVFSKIESTLTGMCGVPGNILLGIPTKGLNATGDNEVRVYYDKIKSDQEEEILDPVEKLTGYITLAKDFKGSKLVDPEITFNPLWQMTEAQLVDMRNKQADTDDKYVQMGVLDPNEVRQNRFGGDCYSIETMVEGDAPEIIDPAEQTSKANA
jgi:phage-related protein (TIGR01555 family)